MHSIYIGGILLNLDVPVLLHGACSDCNKLYNKQASTIDDADQLSVPNLHLIEVNLKSLAVSFLTFYKKFELKKAISDIHVY